MIWTAHDIPDLSGRLAIVTGGNGGLGLESCRALARAGANVIMAARNHEKAITALATIRSEVPEASIEIRPLDLASLTSIETFAESVVGDAVPVDILLNNAGLMAIPFQTTEDGFERQFGTNHLGHFALTARLMPAILAADAGRVVTITSVARLSGVPVDPDNPNMIGTYTPWGGYQQSKLANYHFALALHRRLRAHAAPAASLAAHPGISNTDLQSTSKRESSVAAGSLFWTSFFRYGMSAEAGARPQLRAATDPAARSGEFYGPMFNLWGPAVKRPVAAVDDAILDSLWAISERETGIEFDIRQSMTPV